MVRNITTIINRRKVRKGARNRLVRMGLRVGVWWWRRRGDQGGERSFSSSAAVVRRRRPSVGLLGVLWVWRGGGGGEDQGGIVML